MPNPKRRLSKSKRHKRRTHHVLHLSSFSKCPRCNQLKMPHRVCGNCGYYQGKAVVKL